MTINVTGHKKIKNIMNNFMSKIFKVQVKWKIPRYIKIIKINSGTK